MIGDMNPGAAGAREESWLRADRSRKSDKLGELIAQIVGEPEVDAAIDCVGFEARGHGTQHGEEAPATVLNSLMDDHPRRRRIGIPGLYVTEDPGVEG